MSRLHELPAKLAQKLSKERIVKPEQRAYREKVDERNRRLQERGVPAPKSGTFGGKQKP
jgi:hypothetical protein